MNRQLPFLEEVKLYLTTGKCSPTASQAMMRLVFQKVKYFQVDNNELYYTFPGKPSRVAVIDPRVRRQILHDCYLRISSNPCDPTRANIQDCTLNYYWPTMVKDLGEYIKHGEKHIKAPQIWETIQVDILDLCVEGTCRLRITDLVSEQYFEIFSQSCEPGDIVRSLFIEDRLKDIPNFIYFVGLTTDNGFLYGFEELANAHNNQQFLISQGPQTLLKVNLISEDLGLHIKDVKTLRKFVPSHSQYDVHGNRLKLINLLFGKESFLNNNKSGMNCEMLERIKKGSPNDCPKTLAEYHFPRGMVQVSCINPRDSSKNIISSNMISSASFTAFPRHLAALSSESLAADERGSNSNNSSFDSDFDQTMLKENKFYPPESTSTQKPTVVQFNRSSSAAPTSAKSPEHPCPYCKRVFKNRNKRIDHIRTVHPTDDNRLRCDMCPHTLKSTGSLKSHLKRMHGQNHMLKCTECGFLAKTTSNLNAHVDRIHRKQHKCHHCTFATKEKSSLNRHVEIYHSDRKFPCETPGCHYKATNQKSLNEHIRVQHNRVKSHKCPNEDCNASFKTNSMLRDHMPSHEKYDIYFCMICEYSCKYRSNAHRHAKKKHKEVTNLKKCITKDVDGAPDNPAAIKLKAMEVLREKNSNGHNSNQDPAFYAPAVVCDNSANNYSGYELEMQGMVPIQQDTEEVNTEGASRDIQMLLNSMSMG